MHVDHGLTPQLSKIVTDVVGGKGGGRPDLVQGGGEDIERLGEGLAGVYGFL